MTVWTIVVAAGAGTRFGSAKQYEALGSKRVLDWAADAALSVSAGVVLVVAADAPVEQTSGVKVTIGGATRSESVRAGLASVPDDADVVVVHDAARPLASPTLFEAVVAAVRSGADGAVPGVAIADTVKRVHGGEVVETLDRAALVAVQTPQAFRARALRDAHARGGDATDDASLVEACGGRVVVVLGDPGNVKITQPPDLERLRQVVAQTMPASP